MITTMEEQWIVFGNFPGSKNHWEENFLKSFFFQEMSLKGKIFVNFLPQKIMTKYGIVSTYSVTCLSQKILVCLQCVRPLSDSSLRRLFRNYRTYPHIIQVGTTHKLKPSPIHYL